MITKLENLHPNINQAKLTKEIEHIKQLVSFAEKHWSFGLTFDEKGSLEASDAENGTIYLCYGLIDFIYSENGWTSQIWDTSPGNFYEPPDAYESDLISEPKTAYQIVKLTYLELIDNTFSNYVMDLAEEEAYNEYREAENCYPILF